VFNTIRRLAPVPEKNTGLQGRVCLAQQLLFIKAQRSEEKTDTVNGCFTDTDYPYVRAFDYRDIKGLPRYQRRVCHD
jgi:hypothetical protein